MTDLDAAHEDGKKALARIKAKLLVDGDAMNGTTHCDRDETLGLLRCDVFVSRAEKEDTKEGRMDVLYSVRHIH
ncbi:hypothetical protein PsorP6_011304 [Peronosclerospora sorghi]|uniref:Uncharacterized protein n=1 Tax=Peronosclerospora sorghi TaxID=230839 RepID=A0ACC0WKV4_9STRA|nr:hypothetical protein PsorP6_011304 [Peronosclerospora sorghi]